MKRVYKISILLCLIAVIMLIGKFALAQNKGYFYEKGVELFLLGNLQINGYLAVETALSDNEGLFGDVLVGENLSFDTDSAVNFCTDIEGGNKNCQDKIMIWQPNSLDVIDPDYYQIQAQKLLANNSDLNFLASKTISTNSITRISGCFSNDGSNICKPGMVCTGGAMAGQACSPDVDCPKGFCNILTSVCIGGEEATQSCNPDQMCQGGTCNLGEVKTEKVYLDNMISLASKTNNVLDTITLEPNKLILSELDLGQAGPITLTSIKVNNKENVQQLDLQNLCWDAGFYVATDLKYSGALPGCPALGGVSTTAAFGAYPLTAWQGPYLCCYLNVSL